jgi:hypothetical protein
VVEDRVGPCQLEGEQGRKRAMRLQCSTARGVFESRPKINQVRKKCSAVLQMLITLHVACRGGGMPVPRPALGGPATVDQFAPSWPGSAMVPLMDRRLAETDLISVGGSIQRLVNLCIRWDAGWYLIDLKIYFAGRT